MILIYADPKDEFTVIKVDDKLYVMDTMSTHPNDPVLGGGIPISNPRQLAHALAAASKPVVQTSPTFMVKEG